MAWRKLEDTFYDSPKLKRLARHLDIGRAQAAGHIALLWSWALRHAPDGDISKYDDMDIEDAVEWNGHRGDFLQACAVSLFVDRLPNGKFVIHNWIERGGTYAESKRKQRLRESKKSRPGMSRDIPECPALEENRREENKDIRQTRPNLKNVKQPGAGPTSPAGAADLDVSPKVARDDVNEVWQHYRTHHPRAPAVLKASRKESRLIRQRLEDFAPDELKAAIDGYHRSPFHNGQNDRGAKYLSLELMMRDVSKVQAGLELLEVNRVAGPRVDRLQLVSDNSDSNERAIQ